MSELTSYCQVCGEYGHKAHCGFEYLEAKADADVWRTACKILKQTINNLETAHQKELAAVTAERDEARERANLLLEVVRQAYQHSRSCFFGRDDIFEKIRGIDGFPLAACEEKEPT